MFVRFVFITFVCCLTAMTLFAQTPPIEAGVSQTLATWRAENYSDVRYKLNLTLEKKSPTLKGTIEVSLKNKADQIILDWRKIRGSENLSTVSNVSINGQAAKFEEINEHLVFKEGVKQGENTIKLDFTSPILTSGSAVTRYIDKEDGAEYIYSLFVPSDASTAFPVFDQPDLKAIFQLKLIVPYGWRTVSNTSEEDYSVLNEEEYNEGGETKRRITSQTFYFQRTRPISTYVFAFVAGDFAEFERRGDGLSSPATSNNANAGFPETKIYVRKSQAEKFKQHSAEVFRLNREAVKYFENYFDYRFPFPKYDLVLIPEFPFGGMEHAGATFLRESSVIFPTEPTKNDFINRANLIFHEAAHQWFGDTVTMKWFDDLWLKEGFATFTAYKAMEQIMPEYNAWKVFYERTKQGAYQTDSTKGTVPIYQDIPNLSAAKSAYGNIVYNKAPAFLRQAEFYLGEKEFQTAVRQFLKKHEFSNATWQDLVSEFEKVYNKESLDFWADNWVKQRGLSKIILQQSDIKNTIGDFNTVAKVENNLDEINERIMKFKVLVINQDGSREERVFGLFKKDFRYNSFVSIKKNPQFIFPNYQDYGYGIFLLDEKSRAYVLANIQNEKDDFLRAMMWGSLWDSVREAELAPRDYVELVIKNINVETDESTIQTLLSRVSTAMNYYLSDAERQRLVPQIENLLIEKMKSAPTVGQKITFYRAFLNQSSSENARIFLKDLLSRGDGSSSPATSNNADANGLQIPLKTKDKFDIVTRLLILGDKDAPRILAELEKTETGDEAKRYAYAAKAGIATAENKAKFWNDFVANKEISESWIEAAFVPFNSIRHAELTLPYLEKALNELPNHKRSRKIFFVNGWLAAFIGGQKSEEALQIINKFLADNPNLDKDLRLKILENVDLIERAVKIRAKYKN